MNKNKRNLERIKCDCGCGKLIYKYDTKGRHRFFLKGHHMKKYGHTEEAKEKNRLSNLGKKHTEETKRKMSIIHKGQIPWNKGTKGLMPPSWIKGKTHLEETKRKMSKAKKGITPKNINLLMKKGNKFRFKKGYKHTKETLLKIKLTKLKNGTYKKKHTKEVLEHLSRKAKARWKTKEYTDKLRKSMKITPNNPEKKLIKLIEKHNLDYKYTGDLSFFIGNKNPDFVNTNGEKKVIEIFGDYWHNPNRNKRIKQHQTVKGTIKHHNEYGFDCLIIWENELDNKSLINKLKVF